MLDLADQGWYGPGWSIPKTNLWNIGENWGDAAKTRPGMGSGPQEEPSPPPLPKLDFSGSGGGSSGGSGGSSGGSFGFHVRPLTPHYYTAPDASKFWPAFDISHAETQARLVQALQGVRNTQRGAADIATQSAVRAGLDPSSGAAQDVLSRILAGAQTAEGNIRGQEFIWEEGERRRREDLIAQAQTALEQAVLGANAGVQSAALGANVGWGNIGLGQQQFDWSKLMSMMEAYMKWYQSLATGPGDSNTEGHNIQ